MVQKFRMPKYANIWHSSKKGNKDELLMEAQMGERRRIGGNLLVRTVEPALKQVDLGVILEGGCDKDGDHDFRTEQGWFHIEYNEELSILLDDHVGWMELFD